MVSMYRLLLPVSCVDSVIKNDDPSVAGLTPVFEEVQFWGVELLRFDERSKRVYEPVCSDSFVSLVRVDRT